MKSLSNFIVESSDNFPIKSVDTIYLMDENEKKPIGIKVKKVFRVSQYHYIFELENNKFDIKSIEPKFFGGSNTSIEELLQDNPTVLGYKNTKTGKIEEDTKWFYFSTSKEGIKKTLENKYADKLNSLVTQLNNKQKEIDEINKQIADINSKIEVDMSESKK